jgi:predicted transcriptional regulator
MPPAGSTRSATDDHSVRRAAAERHWRSLDAARDGGENPIAAAMRSASTPMRLPSLRALLAGDLTGALLGPRERDVMEFLWGSGEGHTVRELQRAFPRLAYTTLLTTLDRLYRKGLLDRTLLGRAHVYVPTLGRSELHMRLTSGLLGGLLRADAQPLIASFVEAVSQEDGRLLDALGRLVAERRRRRGAR